MISADLAPSGRTIRTGLAGLAALGLGGVAISVRRRLRRLRERPDPFVDLDRSVLVGDVHRVRGFDGVELHAVDRGEGGVVVLAHGVTASSRFWIPLQEDLVRRGHRVIAYDSRGHADSNVGASGFSVEALGRDLTAVLEHFDVTDAVVVGHSMGGISVQSAAVHCADVVERRVRHVVLCSSLARARAGSELLARLPFVDRLFEIELPERIALAYASVVVFGTPPPPRSLADLGLDLIDGNEPALMAGAAEALADFDLRNRLAHVDVPVTVVYGTSDHITPPSFSTEIVASLTAAKVDEIVYAKAGHLVPWERHAEFADVVAGI